MARYAFLKLCNELKASNTFGMLMLTDWSNAVSARSKRHHSIGLLMGSLIRAICQHLLVNSPTCVCMSSGLTFLV